MSKAEIAFNREARERELIDDKVVAALINKGAIKDRDDPNPIFTRIGLNTGSMVVGNMGTENKMNYTIMGNAVNLAARLEGVNKQYGTRILTSEETINQTGGKFLTRRLDKVRVVGVNKPVLLYELLDMADEAPAALVKLASLFEQALVIFENRDWTAAEAAFDAVLNLDSRDVPAQLYRERCLSFRQKPPEKDWDGIFNLNEK
jgi:hypothetical protein